MNNGNRSLQDWYEESVGEMSRTDLSGDMVSSQGDCIDTHGVHHVINTLDALRVLNVYHSGVTPKCTPCPLVLTKEV